ncbi:MAG: acyl-CoA dehydrogenase [Desulfobacterales bacterium RIFOXYA12_FULL_46_15]|nr:MAG: acyl-CoA dehydrogenase [Desulfobacterales bacterium RIFOXYA12_FULL_46_15]
MAQMLADRRDVDFILHGQLKVEQLSAHKAFGDFNKKTIDLIVSEARALSLKELLPAHGIGDRVGVRYQDNNVFVPPEFHGIYEKLSNGQWIAPSDDARWGGQELPLVVTQAAYNYLFAANYPACAYATLTHGAGKLVEVFGTDKQKNLYLKKMYSGQWSGTMLLTEPEAGSDVGALTTMAEKNEDGTYSLTGNKIFITAGEHDMTENIIHPVLARIKGAPEGARGISLFLVPKYHVNADGSLGERNDIFCIGVEKKMGIHGSATCSMTLGTSGQCIGTLLGEENKGMAAMFVMMNEARLGVGMQGFGCASASYLNALNYARLRIQGRSIVADPKETNGVSIIQHPDVRQMLMTMKVYTEGMRSLLYYTAFLEDLAKISDAPEEKERLHDMIDILIPIAKGYVTDRSFDVCNLGIQVFGGYGYTCEFPQEQLLRDCRITQIYEGTNGIQAMDLLGRKLSMKNGKLFKELMSEIKREIGAAASIVSLQALSAELATAIDMLDEVTGFLFKNAVADASKGAAYAHATLYMEALGDVIMAWMLLWRARAASQALDAGAIKQDILFYEGQIQGVRFFIKRFLPVITGKLFAIKNLDSAPVMMNDKSFGV